jgi:hypothetical protein
MFDKGDESKGGKVGYVKTGDPPLAPLTANVQTIRLGERGPVWQ